MKLPYGLGPSLFFITLLLVAAIIIPTHPVFRIGWIALSGFALAYILWHAWKGDIHS